MYKTYKFISDYYYYKRLVHLPYTPISDVKIGINSCSMEAPSIEKLSVLDDILKTNEYWKQVI